MYLPNKCVFGYVIFLSVMSIPMLIVCVRALGFSPTCTMSNNCIELKDCVMSESTFNFIRFLAGLAYAASAVIISFQVAVIWTTNKRRLRAVPMQAPLFFEDESNLWIKSDIYFCGCWAFAAVNSCASFTQCASLPCSRHHAICWCKSTFATDPRLTSQQYGLQ